MHGAVGEREVGGKIAEEVEGECRRPEQVGVETLVVEPLVALGARGSRSRRGESAGGEEVRAGLLRVGQRQAAADGAGRGSLARDDRLRSDRVPVRFAPAGLVEAEPPAEGRHLRAARGAVVGFPAVRGLQLPERGLIHECGGSRARDV